MAIGLLQHVTETYPWGNPDTLLKPTIDGRIPAPYEWQKTIMNIIDGWTPHHVVKIAVATGHSAGKTALTAWVMLWATLNKPRVKVVAASNALLLREKVWREIKRWHGMRSEGGSCDLGDTALYTTHRQGGAAEYHRVAAELSAWDTAEFKNTIKPYSDGLLLLFDEGCYASRRAWGHATKHVEECGGIWLVLGTPFRTGTPFHKCWDEGSGWTTFNIDTRTIPGAVHPDHIDRWLHEWGEDSNFFRARVRGEFPKQ